jgi:hypothetical protein
MGPRLAIINTGESETLSVVPRLLGKKKLGHAAFNKLAHQLYDLGPYDLYSSVCVSDEGKAITKIIELYLLLSKVTFNPHNQLERGIGHGTGNTRHRATT